MIKYLLLTLDNILECIGVADPNVLQKIRSGASLSELNTEFNLGLRSWEQRSSPLLAKYVNEKDLISENQRLQLQCKELKNQMENLSFNLKSKN